MVSIYVVFALLLEVSSIFIFVQARVVVPVC